MLKPLTTSEVQLAATTTAAALFTDEMTSALYQLRWGILAIALLVCADFYFGLSESVKVKKERFRFSRAGRRTLGKFFEYIILYTFSGAAIGKGILEPLGLATFQQATAAALAIAALFELDSIKDHVCALHGITNKYSVKRFFVAYLKRKNADAGEALEEALQDKNEQDN